MMSLDKLLNDNQQVMLCKVGEYVHSLEPVYKLALLDMLEKRWIDGGLSDDQVAFKMRSAGLAVGATTIRRHRQGLCVCESVVNG